MNKYQQDRASTSEEIRTSEEVRPLTAEEVDAVAGGVDAVAGGQNVLFWRPEAQRLVVWFGDAPS